MPILALSLRWVRGAGGAVVVDVVVLMATVVGEGGESVMPAVFVAGVEEKDVDGGRRDAVLR